MSRQSNQAAQDFRQLGVAAEAVEDDLADALPANAGHGLGRGFLDQDFNEMPHH